MKHLFIPYDIARQLKEKGFDEECLGYYLMILDRCEAVLLFEVPEVGGAPLYQQVIDWFRDKHCIYLSADNRLQHCVWRGWKMDELNTKHFMRDGPNSHEALTKAIEAAIKLI